MPITAWIKNKLENVKVRLTKEEEKEKWRFGSYVKKPSVHTVRGQASLLKLMQTNGSSSTGIYVEDLSDDSDDYIFPVKLRTQNNPITQSCVDFREAAPDAKNDVRSCTDLRSLTVLDVEDKLADAQDNLFSRSLDSIDCNKEINNNEFLEVVRAKSSEELQILQCLQSRGGNPNFVNDILLHGKEYFYSPSSLPDSSCTNATTEEETSDYGDKRLEDDNKNVAKLLQLFQRPNTPLSFTQSLTPQRTDSNIDPAAYKANAPYDANSQTIYQPSPGTTYCGIKRVNSTDVALATTATQNTTSNLACDLLRLAQSKVARSKTLVNDCETTGSDVAMVSQSDAGTLAECSDLHTDLSESRPQSFKHKMAAGLDKTAAENKRHSRRQKHKKQQDGAKLTTTQHVSEEDTSAQGQRRSDQAGTTLKTKEVNSDYATIAAHSCGYQSRHKHKAKLSPTNHDAIIDFLGLERDAFLPLNGADLDPPATPNANSRSNCKGKSAANKRGVSNKEVVSVEECRERDMGQMPGIGLDQVKLESGVLLKHKQTSNNAATSVKKTVKTKKKRRKPRNERRDNRNVADNSSSDVDDEEDMAANRQRRRNKKENTSQEPTHGAQLIMKDGKATCAAQFSHESHNKCSISKTLSTNTNMLLKKYLRNDIFVDKAVDSTPKDLPNSANFTCDEVVNAKPLLTAKQVVTQQKHAVEESLYTAKLDKQSVVANDLPPQRPPRHKKRSSRNGGRAVTEIPHTPRTVAALNNPAIRKHLTRAIGSIRPADLSASTDPSLLQNPLKDSLSALGFDLHRTKTLKLKNDAEICNNEHPQGDAQKAKNGKTFIPSFEQFRRMRHASQTVTCNSESDDDTEEKDDVSIHNSSAIPQCWREESVAHSNILRKTSNAAKISASSNLRRSTSDLSDHNKLDTRHDVIAKQANRRSDPFSVKPPVGARIRANRHNGRKNRTLISKEDIFHCLQGQKSSGVGSIASEVGSIRSLNSNLTHCSDDVFHSDDDASSATHADSGYDPRNSTGVKTCLDCLDYVCDVTLCEPCAARRSERKEIIYEVLSSERNYGKDLAVLQEEFYETMKNNGLLCEDQLGAIFLNLDELIRINKHVISQVEAAILEAKNKNDVDLERVCIGKLFLESTHILLAFEAYCVDQAAASNTLDTLEKEKEVLRVFLEVAQMENDRLRRMNFQSFHMAPIQRIMKYPLLLNRLYNVTSRFHVDKENIKRARLKIDNIIEHINAKTKSGSITNSIRRRWSSLGLLRRAAEDESIEIEKVAFEALGWNRNETAIVMSAPLQMLSPGENVWPRRRSIKFTSVHGLLVSRGKSQMQWPTTVERPVFARSQAGPELCDAALVLVKERSNKQTLVREPLHLRKCFVYQDFVYKHEFELQEISKDPLVLKGCTSGGTKNWLHSLKFYCLALGAWRRRRNALANIMIPQEK